MNRKMLIVLALVCYAIVGLAAVFADVNGKWTGTLIGPDGNPIDVTYTMKVDGGKINGNDFKFSITNPEGVTIPHIGKYIAQGDSISINVDYQGFKMHS